MIVRHPNSHFEAPAPLVSISVILLGEFYSSLQSVASCYSLIQGNVLGKALQIHQSHHSRNLRIKDTALKNESVVLCPHFESVASES